MSSGAPRCPNGTLARLTCVTQKCNASPFICQSNSICSCLNAHRYCKTMKWTSVYQLLTNYRQNLPDTMKAFIQRVQKIYHNIISKLNTQIKVFHQFVEQKLYGAEYSKIMHYLNKNDYSKLDCNSLGTIITKMTERVISKKVSQQGVNSLQKFTLNQMRRMDSNIQDLLKSVEQLYKDKYRVVEKELIQLNSNTITKQMANTRSTISQSHHYSTHNKSTQNFDKFENVALTQSLIFQRTGNVSKNSNYNATSSSNAFNKSTPKIRNNSDFVESKDTQFWNPETSVKSDLAYPKFINSKIISCASVLNSFLQTKVKQYKLIYRASENDYDISEFYNKFASHTFTGEGFKTSQKNEWNHPTTLLLIKTQFGKVIGGFTKLKWSRSNSLDYDDDQQSQNQKKTDSFKQDVRGTSAMFSVDLNEKYQLMDPKFAIYCGRKSIGFGKNDFRIVNHSSKHSKNYIGFPSSYSNGVHLPTKKSSLLLSGSHQSSHFKVVQWEMFQVVLPKQSLTKYESSQINIKNEEINLKLSQLKTRK